MKKEAVDLESKEGMDQDMLDIDDKIQIFKGPLKRDNTGSSEIGNKYRCILESCSNLTCNTKPLSKLTYIKNNIQVQLKKYIKQYYQVS